MLEPATPPNERALARQLQWPSGFDPLPGCVPYENVRPMFVGGAWDGARLGAFLTGRHAHIEPALWAERARAGLLRVDGRPATLDTVVRGGSRFEHIMPDTVEPEVATDLRFVYEDDEILVVSKPAPLPVHPSGRFNRNTLVGLLAHVFGEELRPVHRLDAEVRGLLVLARTKASARALGAQFEARTVAKRYLAGCRNDARLEARAARTIEAPIAASPTGAGGRRRVESSGLRARTEVEILASRDGAALVRCRPISGRTNQIRIHLAHIGLPILGDPRYGVDLGAGAPLELHAHGLEFEHPSTGVPLCLIDAPRPWARGLYREA